jgi:hypothetical protein
MLSEAYGGQVMKKSYVAEWYKRWKMMKGVVVQDLTESINVLK